MKTTIEIFKRLIVYLLFFVVINILFSVVYYINSENISYGRMFILSISGNLDSQLLKKDSLLVLMAIHKFIELVVSSVLTGYIFTFILNREPRVVLPDQLVIRRRTSDNVKGRVSLGIMVCNRSGKPINDVKCTVRCYYVKQKNPLKMNGECQLCDETSILENYYRFSVYLKDFPLKMLNDFMEKDKVCCEKDSITVIVKGSTNFLGNTFVKSKSYSLSDIVIDEHDPECKTDIINPFTGKLIYQRINWDQIQKTEAEGEIKRTEVVKEIQKIIDEAQSESICPPPALG